MNSTKMDIFKILTVEKAFQIANLDTKRSPYLWDFNSGNWCADRNRILCRAELLSKNVKQIIFKKIPQSEKIRIKFLNLERESTFFKK